MRVRFKVALTVLSFFLTATSGSVFGGLAYVNQERLVFANPKGESPTVAPNFGPFIASLADEYTTDVGDYHAARASQSSILGNTFIRASGMVYGASGNDTVNYRTLVAVTFDVTESTPYRLISSLTFDPFHPNALLDPETNRDPLYALTVRQVDGGGATLLAVTRSQKELLFGPGFPPIEVDQSGTLAPGRYELRLNIQSQFNEDEEDGTYRLNFTTGGGPSPAVPLPAAAWMGLLTLGGIAGSRLWAGRRARAAASAL